MSVDGPVPPRAWLSASRLAESPGPVPVIALRSVTSTNDEVRERFEGQWLAVTADEQTQGRGRLDRQWTSPVAAGVALSIAAPLAQVACPVGELPMRVAVAAARAFVDVGVPAELKWPNDLMIDDLKVGGILLALHAELAVIGIGVNTHLAADELPTELASSLALQGFNVEREALITAIASRVHQLLTDRAPVAGDYRALCTTIGREVTVMLASGGELIGTATTVDDSGSIVVESAGQTISVSVGDVVHLRPVRE